MVAWRTLRMSLGALVMLQLPIAATAEEPRVPNSAIRPLLDCRKIMGAVERLSCFDKESAALDEADRKNELTVMDREDVRKTRRSLFGLDLSGLPFLGRNGDDEGKDATAAKEIEEEGRSRITAKITSSRSIGHGKWAFYLDDGAHWVTNEAVTYKDPAPGMDVVIKKTALGGYMADFARSSRQIRVRRVN